MAKYTFIREDDEGEINTTSFEADTWYNALDKFIYFLRGSGCFISNKSVGINTVEVDPYECETANIVAFEKE